MIHSTLILYQNQEVLSNLTMWHKEMLACSCTDPVAKLLFYTTCTVMSSIKVLPVLESMSSMNIMFLRLGIKG